MALLSGTRIGSFEVAAHLGAGGMGEVYRARDSRLHRDVATRRTAQVSNEGGIGPIWSANGRDLFFRGTDGMMMAAAVKLAPDIELSKPRVLFDARRYENSFGVSPDGQRLLMMPLIPTEGSAAQIHVILNFISELRARVR